MYTIEEQDNIRKALMAEFNFAAVVFEQINDWTMIFVSYDNREFSGTAVLDMGITDIVNRIRNIIISNEECWDDTYKLHPNTLIMKQMIATMDFRDRCYISHNQLYYYDDYYYGSEDKMVSCDLTKAKEMRIRLHDSIYILLDDDKPGHYLEQQKHED